MTGIKKRVTGSYLVSTLSIALVLVVVGILAFILLNARQISDHVKQNIGFSIIVKDNVNEAEIKKMQKILDTKSFVASSVFVSKEEAATEFKQELGEDFEEVLGYNPLLPSVEIKLNPVYANICGLTRQEIEHTFTPDVKAVGEMNGLTFEQTMNELTRRYDGYRFTQIKTEGLYNPFSILNVFSSRVFQSYWFATGTPTMLVDILKKTDYDLRKLDGIEVPAAALTDYRMDFHNPVPIIYQSGYLTIKEYDLLKNFYVLGYPNAEVEYGWLNFITPYYTPMSEANAPFYIGKFWDELREGDVDSFMERLRAFFAGMPYELNDKTERHYQVIFYIVFKLLGQYVDVEVRSARGRADAVVKTTDYIYVFEFKLDGSVDKALQQIDDKGYLIPYTVDGRQLVKVGADFNKEDRNIGEWKAVFC